MDGTLDRRAWLRLISVLAAAGAPVVEAQVPAPAPQPAPATPPQRVDKEALHQALKLIGLEFTEAQEAMMLPGINRALAGYEELRKIQVPLDPEPAIRFYPTAPKKRAAKFAPSAVRPGKRPESLEQ